LQPRQHALQAASAHGDVLRPGRPDRAVGPDPKDLREIIAASRCARGGMSRTGAPCGKHTCLCISSLNHSKGRRGAELADLI
jgi:hypothetical protein